MTELWNIAIAGPNIIPSLLLAVILLYWISVIAGAIDINLFDIDVPTDLNIEVDTNTDVDADAGTHGVSGGPFQAALIFFNLADIPLMIFVSFWVLFTWLGTVSLSYILGGNSGSASSLLIIFGNVIGTLFLTKFVTAPLKKILRKSNDVSRQKTVGQLCKLLTAIESGRLGQGEVKTDGAPLTVNVMTRPGCSMEKGQTALIIEKNSEKNFYIIEPFTDWEA